jgi:hypothetical protein
MKKPKNLELENIQEGYRLNSQDVNALIISITHGQTLANTTEPVPSFQL